jgi:hypothetical protein
VAEAGRVILTDRVTLVRRILTEIDDYGNPSYVDEEVQVRATVAPVTSTEPLQRDAPTVTTYRGFLPPSAAWIKGSDGVLWRGQTFEVRGDPEAVALNGRLHHVEVQLVKIG